MGVKIRTAGNRPGNKMRNAVLKIVAGILIASLAVAPGKAESIPPSPLSQLDFMIGNWVARDPGEGPTKGGTSSIHLALGGKVIQRHDHVPLRKGGAFDIDMTIYADGDQLRSEFFDSEGHVIHYRAATSPPHQRAVFESEGDASGPAFRLTYTKVSQTELSIAFEIAPPGPTREYKVYTQGNVRRR